MSRTRKPLNQGPQNGGRFFATNRGADGIENFAVQDDVARNETVSSVNGDTLNAIMKRFAQQAGSPAIHEVDNVEDEGVRSTPESALLLVSKFPTRHNYTGAPVSVIDKRFAANQAYAAAHPNEDLLNRDSTYDPADDAPILDADVAATARRTEYLRTWEATKLNVNQARRTSNAAAYSAEHSHQVE